MATPIDTVLEGRIPLSSVPYSGCNTRIVSLFDVNIPEDATDEEYRSIYARYAQQSSPQDKTSNASLLRDAIESIKYGISPPVAFPTETVYGLGADATNEPATSGIFAAKGRPSDNPLIVHVASVSHLERVTGAPLPEVYKSVAEKFWPGPLTILLPVPPSGVFAKNVHSAQTTIGFRIPSSKYARFFLAATDRPIAGPSANSSGKPSPTTARHVFDDLKGKINFILDGGTCEVGVESTVVDGLHDPPLVLRPGGVSLEELRAFGREIGGEVGGKWARTTVGYKTHKMGHSTLNGNGGVCVSALNGESRLSTPESEASSSNATNGAIDYYEDVNGAPRAPGMKYRHYAPRGRLTLFSEDAFRSGRVAANMDGIVNELQFGSSNLQRPGNENKVNIGIISCRWPPFADLKHAFSSMVDSTNISSDVPTSESAAEKPDTIIKSVYADITTIARLRCSSIDVTLYNVQLGPEISILAHSLFGVLRLFDDLDCAYIFAETVQRSSSTPSVTSSSAPASGNNIVNGENHDRNDRIGVRQARRDLEDAVIDRIEKAAAERID